MTRWGIGCILCGLVLAACSTPGPTPQGPPMVELVSIDPDVVQEVVEPADLPPSKQLVSTDQCLDACQSIIELGIKSAKAQMKGDDAAMMKTVVEEIKKKYATILQSCIADCYQGFTVEQVDCMKKATSVEEATACGKQK